MRSVCRSLLFTLAAFFAVLSGCECGNNNVLVGTPAPATPGPNSPTLTGITPNAIVRGAPTSVTVTGTNLITNEFTFVGLSGNVVDIGSDTGNANLTTITTVLLAGTSAPLGSHTIDVGTSWGSSNALAFTVNPGSQTFNYTGSAQSFSVPPARQAWCDLGACITSLTIAAAGAQGGAGANSGGMGGLAGSVTATIPVNAGDTLSIFVGGAGGSGSSGGAGGFNGGATGANLEGGASGGGGGGASDVRRGGSALANRVVVAAGGGGGGGNTPSAGYSNAGGAGGGASGASGGANSAGDSGGAGGTQSAGGAGGVSASAGDNGLAGILGIGGTGNFACICDTAGGGGGGGGYYGGGGGAGHKGAGDNSGGGGGGGSSFTESTATGVVTTPGTQTGNGQVTITW